MVVEGIVLYKFHLFLLTSELHAKTTLKEGLIKFLHDLLFKIFTDDRPL